MTEKTDIRDSDEKVVEIEMGRLDKKKCSSQFTLSSDCIRRFCEKYREARIILISSWKNGFISSHNEKNTPQIKELDSSKTPSMVNISLDKVRTPSGIYSP